MGQAIVQVDAFTDRPFAGNPAAVCVLERSAPDAWMQAVAAEMNLSETAFVVPRGGRFSLRWFTPQAEVDLCGHATLASAHVLWESGVLAPAAPAVFDTLSGPLTARREDGWIEMDFPSLPVAAAEMPPGLAAALGAAPSWVGRSRLDYLVELASEAEVRALRPDMRFLGGLPVRGVIVTARAEEFDFVSRFFAPALGIDEDPVTGSAHSSLAPFWSERLGRQELVAWQASARGGTLRLRHRGERTLIAGRAVTVLRCDLLVPSPEMPPPHGQA